jgi:hypothetical protein
VARQHGLSPQQLFGWRRQARQLATGSQNAALHFVPALTDVITRIVNGHPNSRIDELWGQLCLGDPSGFGQPPWRRRFDPRASLAGQPSPTVLEIRCIISARVTCVVFATLRSFL